MTISKYCYQLDCVNSIKNFTIKALFPNLEVDDSQEFQNNANK